jgi:dTMP kinase
MSPLRGKFIVLEGIDGAGTTTQAERLRDHFELHMTREPSDRLFGLAIRRALSATVPEVNEIAMALAFAADRADHYYGEIQPLVEVGRNVISDRYLLSSLAYQSVELDRQFVALINQYAPPPDLTLFIDVPVHIAEERRALRGSPVERYDLRVKQEKIAAAYRRELPRLAGALVVVDGTHDRDTVFGELAAAVQACLDSGDGSSSR